MAAQNPAIARGASQHPGQRLHYRVTLLDKQPRSLFHHRLPQIATARHVSLMCLFFWISLMIVHRVDGGWGGR